MTKLQDVSAAAGDVVENFAAAIIDSGMSHLDLNRLLVLWDNVDVGWAGTTGARLRLADGLDRLADAGLINFPSRNGSRWDPALPRLPLRVAIPVNRRQATRALDPASEPWLPELAWAASWIRTARPPQRLRLILVAVNRWLASTLGAARAIVCREERSLQIFEDEKVLASLSGTALFEPGRLCLDLLACEAPAGGIRVARLADAGPVLVVENKAIFDSAWRGLLGDATLGGSLGYAAVVFGGGDEAASLVPDLGRLESLVGVRASRFDYAGDVDVAGVSAAAAFIDAARERGLTAEPARLLWQALGEARAVGEDLTGGFQERRTAIAAATRLKLPEVVLARLREGVRVPQERLDRVALCDTSWWAPKPGCKLDDPPPVMTADELL